MNRLIFASLTTWFSSVVTVDDVQYCHGGSIEPIVPDIHIETTRIVPSLVPRLISSISMWEKGPGNKARLALEYIV